MWMRTIASTLRKGRSRPGVIVHSASRSSDMPGALTYLHARTIEGYLFRLSSSPLSLLASPQFIPRYCILSNTSLSIFTSPDHTTPAARLQGHSPLYHLFLRDAVVQALPSPTPAQSQGWLFELRVDSAHNQTVEAQGHRHVFGCAGEDERARWMQLLIAASGRSSSTSHTTSTSTSTNHSTSTNRSASASARAGGGAGRGAGDTRWEGGGVEARARVGGSSRTEAGTTQGGGSEQSLEVPLPLPHRRPHQHQGHKAEAEGEEKKVGEWAVEVAGGEPLPLRPTSAMTPSTGSCDSVGISLSAVGHVGEEVSQSGHFAQCSETTASRSRVGGEGEGEEKREDREEVEAAALQLRLQQPKQAAQAVQQPSQTQ